MIFERKDRVPIYITPSRLEGNITSLVYDSFQENFTDSDKKTHESYLEGRLPYLLS